MALLCKNCAGTLTFDPSKQMLVCNMCHSAFRAEEVENSDKEILEDSKECREARIYVCNHCGAEVELNESESSSFCLFCGSPAIVFSRIAKAKKPDLIIPFKITREEALDSLEKYLRKSHRLTKKQKAFNIEKIRGIYVPYWKVSGILYDSYEVRTDIGSNDNKHYVYTSISGRMDFDDLPVYGSNMLPEISLGQIDTWNFKDAVPFDEDYLAGFYSDVADEDFSILKEKAANRSDVIFKEKTHREAKGSFSGYTAQAPVIDITRTPDYVLVPIWFITLDNNDGTRSTFMMNGQTGQSAGTFPVRFKDFFKGVFKKTAMVAGIVAALALILGFFFPEQLGTVLMDIGFHSLGIAWTANPILLFLGAGFLLIANHSRKLNKDEHKATEYSSKRREA